ncbi:MAG: phosphatidate cytidylyltransferase [Burkholderiales bacterium]|nr:phosphatidate cytidylyltransferase [Burkholderiales bacterium]
MKPSTPLKQRVITALALLAVLLGAVWLGRASFVLVAAVLTGAAAFEWLRLAGLSDRLAVLASVSYALLLLAGEIAGRTPSGPVLTLVVAGASAVWLSLFVLLLQAERSGAHVGRMASVILCFTLLTAGWMALLHLHSMGLLVLLSVLALVWVADIAAYFTGRALGRRKLAPHISPGKTWAGVGGAVVAVLLLALLAHQLWPGLGLFSNALFERMNLLLVMALLAALVGISIVGDLFESLMKRQAGRKDSSGLLPGHGGVLDRIDALLPVLPAVVLIQRLFT